MKRIQTLGLAGLAVILCTAGCGTTRPITTATSSGTVSLATAEGSKGYVEFFSRQKHAPIAIYRMDENQRRQLLGVIGLQSGDWYRTRPGESPVSVSERLRVAISPGNQTFVIQRDGQRLNVSVVADKTTTVELDYMVVERSQLAYSYRVNAYVSDPALLESGLERSASR